ncbi:DUF3987 domain-containing protein [Aeromonas veronii]|uniref:DUF3987 domain-containing protein n=1 Tax=Aeromonas veronii TaxID=654 RepID=UPI001E3AABD3|nr:DUF3987 domain-containing protein [Aeromonas veronii]MCD6615603.1 DUF3987 domain-containing protein [Aeromonas veronii]
MHRRKPPPSYHYPRPNSLMCNLLPMELQHVVIEVRQLTQADDDIIINSMLNAMAIAVQATTDIYNPLTEKPIPLSLYCVTVADSGTRKTTVDNIFSAPFQLFEQAQQKSNQQSKEKHEHEKIIHQVKLRALKTKLRKAYASDDGPAAKIIEDDIFKLNQRAPSHIPSPVILVRDITQSALMKELCAPWNNICLSTDEAGQILNSKNFSTPSFYNDLWDAKEISMTRVASGRQAVKDYRFSMNLMLQPSLFAKYVRRHGESARESGFFARCLFALPRPLYRANHPLIESQQTPHLTKFLTRVECILNEACQCFISKQYSERRSLRVDNDVALYDLDREKSKMLANNSSNAVLDAPQFIQRVTEHALRLAGVMHAFSSDEDSVSDTILDAAIKMTMEYSYQYQQAIDYTELTVQLVDNLLTFIIQHARPHYLLSTPAISKTLLLQRGPSKLRKKEQLDTALAILQHNQEISIHRISNGVFIAPTRPSFSPALSAPHVPGSSL